MVVFARFRYQTLRALAPVLVVTSLGLLARASWCSARPSTVPAAGSLGPAVFQPSELAKLALAVWAAAYLSRRKPPQTLKRALASRRRPRLRLRLAPDPRA